MGKTFYATQKSTKEEIKKLAQASNPKEVFHRLIEEKGGVEELTSPGEHPRSYQQVADYRRSGSTSASGSKAPDSLVDLMQICKRENRNPESAFVRQVYSSPELQAILCTNRQLREIEQFCTNPELFSPLSVDVTFNIGDFYVAVTTYRNLLLKTKNGCHPVMIGPVMIHQQRLYESYHNLASSLIRLNPKLKHILCYGTDEERNLYKAFGDVFPFAVHLLCDIHMEDNVMRKLTDLGVSKTLANDYRKEIFGKNVGTAREAGLVDCLTEEDFRKRLDILLPVWEKRHSKGKQFYEYFLRKKAPLVLSCMGAATRMMAGLGYPPDVYTQNGSECANFIIKNAKNKNKLDMIECVELIRKVVVRQETLEYLAMCGQGEWFLDEIYVDQKMEETNFYRMTKEQRKKAFETFYVLRPDRSNPASGKSSCSGDPASGGDPSLISVPPEDTQILHIPFQKLKGVFSKSSQILRNTASDIHRFGDSVFYVASKSSPDNPHKVIHKGNGKFTCDTSCVNWATYKFCAHTLAVAEVSEETREFLNKVALEAKPDATSLALLDMPKGRGKKVAERGTGRRKGGPIRKKSHTVVTYITPTATTVAALTSDNTSECPQIATPETSRTSFKRPSPSSGAFVLTSLKYCDSRVSICYGCNQKLRDDAAVPQPPLDLVIVGKMRREYIQDGQKRLSKESNVYFHAVAECVTKKAPVFIPALLTFHPEDIKEKVFVQAHKDYIVQKLGL